MPTIIRCPKCGKPYDIDTPHGCFKKKEQSQNISKKKPKKHKRLIIIGLTGDDRNIQHSKKLHKSKFDMYSVSNKHVHKHRHGKKLNREKT